MASGLQSPPTPTSVEYPHSEDTSRDARRSEDPLRGVQKGRVTKGPTSKASKSNRNHLNLGWKLEHVWKSDIREVLLPDVDSKNSEVFSKNGGPGYALLALMDDKGGPMLRPHARGSHYKSKRERQTKEHACTEYIACEEFQYNTENCDTEIGQKVEVLSMEDLSVWPLNIKRLDPVITYMLRTPEGNLVSTTSETPGAIPYVEKTFVDQKMRYIREYKTRKTGSKEREYDTCGCCSKPIDIEIETREFFICTRCKNAIHTRCASVKTQGQYGTYPVRLPLQIPDKSLLDRDWGEVVCPTCNNKPVRLVPHQIGNPVKEFVSVICIDIGTERPKVCIMDFDPDKDEPDVLEIDAAMLPVSAIFVLPDGKLVARENREQYDNQSEKCIAPFKAILVDAQSRADLGNKSIRDAFSVFCEEIMNAINATRPRTIEERFPSFAKTPKESRQYSLRVCVALPSGWARDTSGKSSDEQKDVLGGLEDAGKYFVKTYLEPGDSSYMVHPTVLPESEMSLLQHLENGFLQGLALVFDAGATTLDASLHGLYVAGLRGGHKTYFAYNIRHGAVNLMKAAMTKFAIRGAWDELYNFVAKAKKRSFFRDRGKQKELDDFLKQLKDDADAERDAWIKEICDKIMGISKGQPISVLLTGGGMIDDTAYQRFREVVKNCLPGATIVNNRGSQHKTSAVREGLQQFAKNLIKVGNDKKNGNSPIAYLQETNLTGENALDESLRLTNAVAPDLPSTHVLLTNQGDPCHVRVLTPFGQPRPGQYFPIFISWGDEIPAEIRIFAQHGRVVDLVLTNGLESTREYSKEELFLIAVVRIPRPSESRAGSPQRDPPAAATETGEQTVAYLATWPDPWSRTIRTRVHIFDKKLTDKLDVDQTPEESLRKLAIATRDGIYCMDTFSVERRGVIENERRRALEKGQQQPMSTTAQAEAPEEQDANGHPDSEHEQETEAQSEAEDEEEPTDEEGTEYEEESNHEDRTNTRGNGASKSRDPMDIRNVLDSTSNSPRPPRPYNAREYAKRQRLEAEEIQRAQDALAQRMEQIRQNQQRMARR